MADCKRCGVANDDDSREWYICASCAAERLQPGPHGEDKIDELQDALEQARFKIATQEDQIQKLLVYIAQKELVCQYGKMLACEKYKYCLAHNAPVSTCPEKKEAKP